MEILLYLSAIIAALALVLIAVYLIITLKTVMNKTTQITNTIERTEKKIDSVSSKAETLMNKADSIADDAQNKLKAFDGVAESVGQLKASIHYMDQSLNEVSERLQSQGKPDKAMKDTLKWGDTAISLFGKYKNFKKKQDTK